MGSNRHLFRVSDYALLEKEDPFGTRREVGKMRMILFLISCRLARWMAP